MKKFILKLMILSDKFPDGFGLVLPDGSIISVKWVIGHQIELLSDGGVQLKQVFGVQLTGSDFDEVIIPLYVAD